MTAPANTNTSPRETSGLANYHKENRRACRKRLSLPSGRRRCPECGELMPLHLEGCKGAAA